MPNTSTTYWFPWDYLMVTFGFSWLCWLPGVLESLGFLNLPIPIEVFLILGVFGPLVGAMWSLVQRDGWRAARGLLARVLDVRFGLVWWLMVLILPLTISAMVFLITQFAGGEVGEPMVLSKPWMILPTFFLMLVLGGGQEEFGWRGTRWTFSKLVGAHW